jgi:hypothetical protein
MRDPRWKPTSERVIGDLRLESRPSGTALDWGSRFNGRFVVPLWVALRGLWSILTLTTEMDPVQIETRALHAPVAEAADFLQRCIGQRLTAYVCGLKDSKTVGRWAAGVVEPRETARLRLRVAYHAALLLVEAYGPETATAWFVGTNGALADEAPAWVLRHGEDLDDLRAIVPAAKTAATAGLVHRESARFRRGRGYEDLTLRRTPR